MKLKCPSCNAVLNIDTALGKLLTCPKCENKFVSNQSHVHVEGAEKAKAAAKSALPIDSNYEMDGTDLSKSNSPAPEYTKWKNCVNCGAVWTAGSEVCFKCNFNARLNRCVLPEKRGGPLFKFDLQKIYLWLGLIAAAAGIYWLVQNAALIKVWINNLWPKY